MRRILAAALTASTLAMIAIAAPALAEELARPWARSEEKTAALTDLDVSDTDLLVSLHCRGRVTDRGTVVGCAWRADESIEVSGWQLWRLRVRPVSDGRQLVAELGADVTSYRDTTVTEPATYLYVVLGTDQTGEVVARSRPALARVAEHPRGGIHLGCHIRWDPTGPDDEPHPADAVDPVRRPAIGCRWEPSDRADIRGYTVLRSVDSGPRTVIAEIGADVTSIVDLEVAFGHSYTYLVQGHNHEGQVVAHSRPVKVGIPRWHRDWPTDRLHDRVVDGVGDESTDRVTDHQTDQEADRVTDHERDRVIDDVTDRPSERPSDSETDRATDGEHDSHADRVGESVSDANTDVEPGGAVTDGHADDPVEAVIERSDDAEPSADRLPADH